ncbi:MAG TPA: GNAT family N-acetyltransferase [Streptosporangiaceae bacterium]
MLATFDAEVRRSVRPDGSGALIEADGLVVRWAGVDARGWSGIAWSGLGEADADTVIAEQVTYFAARGEKFEWKLYDYDRPPDLAKRLAAAGLVAEGEESLMVAEVPAVPADVALPPGVRLLPVTDETGVGLLIEVHERVFGTDHSRLRRSLLAQLRDHPEVTAMVVAMAGNGPVSSARIEFLPGTSFASLWGGGTLPNWRGQGIYRALVAYRAQLAAARGYRYLYVDASPDSQPILARLGFSRLARTTPYIWDPSTQA